MLITFGRTIILYVLVLIIIRIMGKRQLGQLQPFELVVTLMLAELATVPMEDKDIPLIDGIIPLVTILLAQVLLSYISLNSQRARRIICGTPSIVIRDGQIQEAELRRLRFNLNDLLEQLRIKNVTNIADVEFAIFETNGSLSVILKSQRRPVTPADLSLSTSYEGLPTPLIIDGELQKTNLDQLNLSTAWLRNELRKFGYQDVEDVLFASLDSQGNLFHQGREACKARRKT